MALLEKKIPLSMLLKLQLFYCFLGVGYNVISYLLVLFEGRRLSANAPMTGGVFMLFYGLCLITGYKQLLKPYRIIMSLFVVVIGYTGFIVHFLLYLRQPAVYHSLLAFLAAVAINFFGLILNFLAGIGRFEIDRK